METVYNPYFVDILGEYLEKIDKLILELKLDKSYLFYYEWLEHYGKEKVDFILKTEKITLSDRQLDLLDYEVYALGNYCRVWDEKNDYLECVIAQIAEYIENVYNILKGE